MNLQAAVLSFVRARGAVDPSELALEMSKLYARPAPETAAAVDGLVSSGAVVVSDDGLIREQTGGAE